MRTTDIAASAVRSTFRSKLRTSLTVTAIVIGAFTLTITNGLGTGINAYIDDTVAAIGAENVLTITKTVDTSNETDEGVRQYDPESSRVVNTDTPPGAAQSVEAITDEEIEELRTLDSVESAERQVQVSPDYIQFEDDEQFEFAISNSVPGATLQLAAGEQLQNESTDYQLIIPVDHATALGCDDPADCVGITVSLAITDSTDEQHTIDAEVVGVSAESLGATAGGSANTALTSALFDKQSIGVSESTRTSYASATVTVASDTSEESITSLRDELTELGYDSQTVGEQIGTFRSVIDGIILVLNAFGAIALVAAGFGIVNTLLMSVQERTREIGLMKAVGLSGRKIFALFSAEAVFIGFLGSAIGAILGIIVGTVASDALAVGLLGDLVGLTLIAFTPAAIAGIVVLIMTIAFLAGTLPALRAARKIPIEALRYE